VYDAAQNFLGVETVNSGSHSFTWSEPVFAVWSW